MTTDPGPRPRAARTVVCGRRVARCPLACLFRVLCFGGRASTRPIHRRALHFLLRITGCSLRTRGVECSSTSWAPAAVAGHWTPRAQPHRVRSPAWGVAAREPGRPTLAHPPTQYHTSTQSRSRLNLEPHQPVTAIRPRDGSCRLAPRARPRDANPRREPQCICMYARLCPGRRARCN
jgi:hypothetical protein